jgi:hypothetical protein
MRRSSAPPGPHKVAQERLDDLVQRLAASTLAQREFVACLERIQELRPWTDDSIAQLRELAASQSPTNLLVLTLNRTEEAAERLLGATRLVLAGSERYRSVRNFGARSR